MGLFIFSYIIYNNKAKIYGYFNISEVKNMITAKQRVKAALEFRETDRIPKYDSFWLQTVDLYMKSGLEERLFDLPVIDFNGIKRQIGNPFEDYFNFDIDVLYMDTSLRMPYKTVAVEDNFEIIEDHYGYTVKKFKDKSSSMYFLNHITKDRETWDKIKHRLKFDPNDLSRLDSYSYFLHAEPYPNWESFSGIYDAYRKRNKYMLYACYGPWEGTWRHRGFTQLLMDSVLDTNWACEMLEYHAQLTIDTLAHAIKLGAKPDGIYLIDDLGSTQTTLISADSYRECLKPQHKKIADFCHCNDIKLFLHSCGNIVDFIPDFIEAGIDVLQPLQANTGMDVVKLKEQFGNSIVFFGNISAENLAGSKEQIEKEIKYKIDNAKKGGGYIYHSDHSIPDNVCFDNYEYIMELVDKYGSYR